MAAPAPLPRIDADVIVIGSGYGGLLPAWRLARAGVKVLLLERGKRWREEEFRQSWDPIYLSEVYDNTFSDALSEIYRTSRVLGGGSVMNSMMHQRTPSVAFEYEERGGARRAWPRGVDRAALDPHYAEAERLLGVRQLRWEEVPRPGGNFARLFAAAGMSCEPGRFNLGEGCVRCGFCEAGCRFVRGKITLLERALPEALATGNLTVIESLSATRIAAAQGGIYRVEAVATGKPLSSKSPDRVFHAPRVFLGAGPMGTVPLLWRSRATLPRVSKALGEHVSNNGDVNFLFRIPDSFPDHLGYRSTNNAGTISYAFWDEHRVTMHPGFSPVGVMAGIDVRRQGGRAWGLEHKHMVRDLAVNRMIPVNAMRQVDPWLRMRAREDGTARVIQGPDAQVRAHGEYMLALAERVASASGAEVLLTGAGVSPLDQGGNHLLGGARMAEDAREGVISPEGEAFGHPGLYVSDAAAIPSALGINPALTIAANALRTAEAFLRKEGA